MSVATVNTVSSKTSAGRREGTGGTYLGERELRKGFKGGMYLVTGDGGVMDGRGWRDVKGKGWGSLGGREEKDRTHVVARKFKRTDDGETTIEMGGGGEEGKDVLDVGVWCRWEARGWVKFGWRGETSEFYEVSGRGGGMKGTVMGSWVMDTTVDDGGDEEHEVDGGVWDSEIIDKVDRDVR